MPENTLTLPEGYRELLQIDLQHDKKLAVLVNGLSLALMAALGLLGHFLLVPITTLFSFEEGAGMYFLRFGVLIGGNIVYIILHELVHGACMKHYSGVKARYGFTGLYACAGSDAYFNKKCYVIIALAPVVVWGIVLFVLNCLVPESWFWVVYMIQVANLAGAAGDYYVTWKFSRLPADVLVRDTGTAMTVFSMEK